VVNCLNQGIKTNCLGPLFVKGWVGVRDYWILENGLGPLGARRAPRVYV